MNYTKAELEAARRIAAYNGSTGDWATLGKRNLDEMEWVAHILETHLSRVCGDLETAVAELRADERHVKAEALQEALDILNGEYLP